MDSTTTQNLVGLGQRLRAARESKKLSIDEVATTTSIEAPLIAEMEAGTREPFLDEAAPLARLYEVSLDELAEAMLSCREA